MTPREPRRTIVVSSSCSDLDSLKAKADKLGIDIIIADSAPRPPMPFAITPLKSLGVAMERTTKAMKEFAKQLPSLEESQERAKREQQRLTLKDRKKLLAAKKRVSK